MEEEEMKMRFGAEDGRDLSLRSLSGTWQALWHWAYAASEPAALPISAQRGPAAYLF